MNILLIIHALKISHRLAFCQKIASTNFFNNKIFQPDFKWNLLSLLIHIAYNPTGHLKDFVPNNNLRIRSLTINEESPDGRAILSKDLNLKTDYDSDALSVTIIYELFF